MSALTRVKARPVSPNGFEVKTIAAQAVADLDAGEIVTIAAAAPDYGYPFRVDLCPAVDAKTDKKKYVVVMDAKANGVVNIADDLEMDGWSGLTKGDPVYPSGTVAGGLDTTAPTNAIVETIDADVGSVAVPVAARMWAISATRIKFGLG